MKYCSTRGRVTGLSFEEALFSGYASDGGILLPETIPTVDKETLKSWAQLPYREVVKNILHLYVGKDEVPQPAVNDIVDQAFDKFDIKNVVQLARLADNLNVAELYHGPSLAFKDLALSVVGAFIQHFLSKKKKHVTILVGTSGDTGSAAIEAVRGLPTVDVIVLYPKGRCSAVQERQMTTVNDNNVHVYEVAGSSDDLDVPIKECFEDETFVKAHNLCSINSINWCRIMVQIAHYVWAYLQMYPQCDGEVSIAVPTGALGNITAGIIARMMGVRVQLVACVNVNDIVQRTFTSGVFTVSSQLTQTIAPAMDILEPYNMERILYLLSDGDSSLVRTFQDSVQSSGSAVVPEHILTQLQAIVTAYSFSDSEIRAAIQRCHKDNDNYLICPHTATAVQYYYTRSTRELKTVCLATASPLKFEEAITSAGLTLDMPHKIRELLTKDTHRLYMRKGEAWTQILKDKIQQITKSQ